MARFCFSNHSGLIDAFISRNVSVGFKKYSTHIVNNVKVGVTFKKLSIDNVNTLSWGNDFVSAVGTYFYKGKMAGPAIEEIYQDVKEGKNVAAIRQEMYGNFALAVCVNNMLYICGDAMGIYYLYFYNNPQTHEWMVGTNLLEMCRVANFKITCNEYNLLEECFSYAILGDGTIFNEFKKVTGDRICKINLLTNSFIVERDSLLANFVVNENDIDTIAHDTSKDFLGLAKILKDNFGPNNIALCMTGGLDARMTMGALLENGVRPAMYYGVGNSALTNTKVGDLKIDEMYAKKYNLLFTVMNWTTPHRIDKAWDKYIERYGELAHLYTGSPYLNNSLESVKEDILLFGFFGELYRNIPLIENDLSQKSISIRNIIEDYYVNPVVMKSILENDYEDYVKNLTNKVTDILKPYLNTDGVLPIEFFTVFDMYKRINTDTQKMNFCNQQRYSMSLLGDRKFMKNAMIHPEKVKEAQLILKIINVLYPSLLELPVFSRCQYRSYDRDANKVVLYQALSSTKPKHHMVWLRPIKRTIFWKGLKKIKFYLSNPFNYKYYSDIARDAQSMEDVSRQLVKMYPKYPFFKRVINPFISDYISKEAHLAMLLYTLHKVNITEFKNELVD